MSMNLTSYPTFAFGAANSYPRHVHLMITLFQTKELPGRAEHDSPT